MPDIAAFELEKKFRSLNAVDQLSFEVNEGEVFGLLGPNGAGKTTTIRLLACLITPSGGSALVCGFNVKEEPRRVRQNVGILTENPCLYERLTAYENMDFFAQAYGVNCESERKERIRDLLIFFSLWDRKTQRVAYFSNGMKRKLAIARALVHKPQVLLLDEPTASLDPKSAMEVREMITRLSQSEKRTIVLCTHRLEDAEKLCNRVMIIDRGKQIATGTPEVLQQSMNGSPVLEVELTNPSISVADSIRSMRSVRTLMQDDRKLLITLDDSDSTPNVVTAIVQAGGQVTSVRILKPSLEDVYLKMLRRSNQ